jgi:small-conductance mechanosensitive channel
MKSVIEILLDQNRDEIIKFMVEKPGMFILVVIADVLILILLLAAYFFLAWLCLKASRKIFSSIERWKGKKIYLQFAESLVKLAIIIIFFVIPLGGDKIGHSLLGSAAVLAAVVGFAAQDVIKDILAGIQISIYKPFDLGNRIELEDGTAGIVEAITMRHVVLRLMDTVILVIPNSTIYTQTIKNYSYENVPRSVQFNFPVDYKTDIKKAKQVIFDAIKESPYSYPGKKDKNGEMIYGPVYFININDSSLDMKVTVYYLAETPTEILKDDINARVFEALGRAGIEVPYPYTSVVMR